MSDEMMAETVAVTLARMEGTLNNVNDRLGGVIARVDRHETLLGTLQLSVQRLDLNATSSAATVIATASALKDAKEAQEATSRAEAAKTEQAWSPITRLFAILTAIGGLASVALTIYVATHPHG
jgi:hypothetical protein